MMRELASYQVGVAEITVLQSVLQTHCSILALMDIFRRKMFGAVSELCARRQNWIFGRKCKLSDPSA